MYIEITKAGDLEDICNILRNLTGNWTNLEFNGYDVKHNRNGFTGICRIDKSIKSYYIVGDVIDDSDVVLSTLPDLFTEIFGTEDEAFIPTYALETTYVNTNLKAVTELNINIDPKDILYRLPSNQPSGNVGYSYLNTSVHKFIDGPHSLAVYKKSLDLAPYECFNHKLNEEFRNTISIYNLEDSVTLNVGYVTDLQIYMSKLLDFNTTREYIDYFRGQVARGVGIDVSFKNIFGELHEYGDRLVVDAIDDKSMDEYGMYCRKALKDVIDVTSECNANIRYLYIKLNATTTCVIPTASFVDSINKSSEFTRVQEAINDEFGDTNFTIVEVDDALVVNIKGVNVPKSTFTSRYFTFLRELIRKECKLHDEAVREYLSNSLIINDLSIDNLIDGSFNETLTKFKERT